jgi:hypothetical protein
MPDPSNTPDQPRPPLAESLPPEDDLLAEPVKPAPRIPAQGKRAQFQNEPEVDAAIRQSGLDRVRGDKMKAEQTLREALTRFPASGALHEALGDILAERGSATDALANYRRAQSCGAGAGIESKIARIALKQDPHMGGLNDNIVERGTGPVAIVASCLIPGLGLALAGDYRNAGITFGGWLIANALILVIPPLRDVYEAMRGHAVASAGATFWFILLTLIWIAFWTYSIILTAQVAKPVEKDGS